MKIRKAQIEDLEQILSLYEGARKFMAENGNPNQWGKTNPPKERVKLDIEEQKSYVCMKAEQIVGVFYFSKEDDPTYHVIEQGEWVSDKEYAVVHRVATAPDVKGVGSFCLNWAYEQFPNLRIDTHKENIPMQGLLKKLGFTYCGVIYLMNGDSRIAFQKCNQ